MKIDIHTHIVPKDLPDWTRKFGYGGFVRIEHVSPCTAHMVRDGAVFRRIEANSWDPQTRLRECDEQGVAVQVLSTVPVLFGYRAKPADGREVSRFLNDHIAEVVSRHPRRFVGLGTLPLQAPDLAVEELERCVRTLGMAGVEIGTHVGDWNLDKAELFEVFEAAEALGAAVFVHPWDMMGQDQMPKYWLPWLVGMPAETSRAICSMIFGGVLERLPRLRVAFAHGGGSFPFTLGRIEHGFRVRPDLCAVDNPVSPRRYLDRIFVDSLVHDPQALHFLLRMFGAERVALGTDYPFPLGERPAGALIASMAELDEPTRRELYRGTALRWLGLSGETLAG